MFVKYSLFIFTLLYCNLLVNAQNDNQGLDKWLPVFFPLKEKDFVRMSSIFGYRKHPILQEIRKHKGIDLVAEKGKPVYASADGEVTKSDFHKQYGKRILITHSGNIKTLYAHLMDQFVKPGHHIKQGQLIGTVGETGLATGPHLHFEIWVKEKKINPLLFWELVLAQRKGVNSNKVEKNHG